MKVGNVRKVDEVFRNVISADEDEIPGIGIIDIKGNVIIFICLTGNWNVWGFQVLADKGHRNTAFLYLVLRMTDFLNGVGKAIYAYTYLLDGNVLNKNNLNVSKVVEDVDFKDSN